MPRLIRTVWAKVIVLAALGAVAVGSLTLAGVGLPLFPDAPGMPGGPGQRSGSAEGRSHLLGKDRANHEVPQSLRARYPLTTAVRKAKAEAGNSARVVPNPKTDVTGFDRKTSKELPGEREARSRTYLNEDGTRTTELSAAPLNYRDDKGDWRHIDAGLKEKSGGWGNTADAIDTRIAKRADAAEVAEVTLPSGTGIAYGLRGSADVRGKAKGDTVTYPGVLHDTDLELQSQAGGLKETLVLHSADAPASFAFPLSLRGLTASRHKSDGSIQLKDADGTVRARIPAGFMEDADGALSRAVQYRLADGGRTLHVTVDRDWLTDKGRAFPVRVDPSVDTTSATTSMYVRSGSGSVVGSSELHVGKGPDGATASYLAFSGLDEELRHHKIFGAQLQVTNYDAASCRARPVTVHPVTEGWSAGTGTAYPGPNTGAALASRSFAHGYVGLGQSSSRCPARPELFDLGKGGRDLVQGWVDGSKPNHGLSLRASSTDSTAFKKFAGHGTANPPKLFVTHSPYNATYTFPKPVPDPPVLQNQDGKVKVTVTNKGGETWTPSTYYLAYRAYDSKGKLVTQRRAANLTGNVAYGGKTTLDATIKALPPGSYLLDFTMVRQGGKVFTDEQVPPGRLVLQVFDIAPVVKEQYPPNGYQAQTLTPQLWASGVDIDAPPGQTLQYKFEICEQGADGKPTGCTTSPYQSGSGYTVPAGRLVWGKTYLWRGFVKDAANEVPTAQIALLTSVPQPEITSRLSGTTDKEFDPNAGNFSTAGVDASLGGVGPEMSLIRSYNSVDPRRDLAFGAGWTTRYDMRLTPDGDGSGNVVIRYPDGQDVRFGKNPDGSYAPPPGRHAKLTHDATAGTYKLQDKSGTTYDFSSSGLLVKVTDNNSQPVTYTYSGGKLATAENPRTGRKLTFTWTGAHVTKVATNPVGGAALSWTYEYAGDLLKKVCNPESQCTTYDYTAGSHYRSSVLDSRPESYWRLGDPEGTSANSEVAVNLGKDRGTYTNVTLGAAGPVPGDPGTAATFNGSSSRVQLPGGTLKKSRDAAVEVWFKTPATGVGGPLLGYQDKAWGTAPGTGVPLLYVGNDGKLRGQFWTGSVAPITAVSKNVNDGNWHHAVLSASGSDQTLYLDGVAAGTITGKPLNATTLTHNQIGAAHASTPASWPGWGSAGARSFAGTISNVAVYHHPLGQSAVTAHRAQVLRAADVLTKTTLPSGRIASEVSYDPALDRVTEYTDRDGGTWKVGTPAVFGDADELRRTVEVQDPVNSRYFYEYDGLTSRLLRYGQPMALGVRPDDPQESPEPPDPDDPICTQPDPGDPAFCTNPPGDGGAEPDFIQHPVDGVAIRSYEYNDQGFQTGVISETGDKVTIGYDDRGNPTTRTTCRTKDVCQTTYTTYPPSTSDFDLRADQPSETRDGRSSSATDNRYRTQYKYNAKGQTEAEIAPDGGSVRTTYTTGAEIAVGGGNTPTGLPLNITDPRGKITSHKYFATGDLAQATQPSGLITKYTYDELGRKLTETEISDSYPNGVTTAYSYDKLSRITAVTGPKAANAVTAAPHQQRTSTSYDADGNVTRTEVSDVLGSDQSRVMSFDLDDHGRTERITDAEGNETSYTFDALGNQTSLTDAGGNHYEYAYTRRNMIAEVRLHDWEDDGGDGDYTVLHSYAYDMAGRMARHTDAMGRSLRYSYFGDDLLDSITLQDFRNPDGTKRDVVIESNTYDGAGNVLTETTDNGKSVTRYTYDPVGRVDTTTTDPGGINRKTDFDYDVAGNVLTSTSSGNGSNVPWPVSVSPEKVTYKYDDAGNAYEETATSGTDTLTTKYGYDDRGMTLSETDPAGNRTDYGHDELGRPVSVTAPAVAAESGGGAPQTVRPTTFTGYDTFGSAVDTQDARGRVSHAAYDRLGRTVSTTAPTYTTPDTGEVLTPTVTNKYDALGNVVESTDPKGRVSRFEYDRQNRLTVKDLPMGQADDRAKWAYSYTRTGEVQSVTDPTGARAENTYDDLDRPVTVTQLERHPTPQALTTRYAYDDAGNVLRQTDPSGAYTQMAYDALSQLTQITEASGAVTKLGYDAAGNEVRRTDGMGRSSAKLYNGFGQLVWDRDLDAGNNELRRVEYGYDLAGNLTSSKDPLNNVTTYEYDAMGRQTKQVEPVTDTKSITTSFGYDAAGNRTRYTDGRGNATIYTSNSLGLPESVIEPATARDPAAADRTWTTAYNALGEPVRMSAPGGVQRQRTYDKAGLLVKETGTGAEAATPDKTFDYDKSGRMTKASAPKGDNSYTYNDRGLLLGATGPSGEATYTYDQDGLLKSRKDASGTSNFTYAKQQLDTVQDSLTGSTQNLDYDAAGELKKTGYEGGQSRAYTYDDLGRIDTDTVKNSGGQTVSSVDYGYDNDDHLTSKKTTGTAKPGENTYAHDKAGRLDTWTAPDGATTDHDWDDSGNRVKNGAKTSAFDERNRLLSDGDYTYDHTPRGTLSSRTSSGFTEEFTFDAFDRMTKAGEAGTSYTYDALDRVASRNGTDFAYAGLAPDPVKDGSATYSRGPMDELLSVAEGSEAARLSLTDSHGDVVGGMDAADGASGTLAESTAYDPFGQVTGEQQDGADAAAGSRTGNAGYQGDWTDPLTDQVNMGARWYDPGTGAFDSRDSVTYGSGPSVLANRYTYGAGAPMDYSDPGGYWPSCGWCKKAWNKTKSAVKSGWRAVKKGASYVKRAVVAGWRFAKSAIRSIGSAISKAARWVYQKAKSAVRWVNQKVRSAVRWVASRAASAAKAAAAWARERAAEAKRAAIRAAKEVTRKAKAAIARAVKYNPIPDLIAAAKPLISAVKTVVSAAAHLPAAVTAITRNVVADVARTAAAIRDTVVTAVGEVVETVSVAVQAAVEYARAAAPVVWDAIKTAGAVAYEASGLADITACVTEGDAEACMWAAATVAGALAGGAGAVAVRSAKAARLASKAAKGLKKAEQGLTCAADTADAAGAVASANSFVPGTKVAMADGTKKPIEEVKEGEKVRATDPTTGKTSVQKVTDTITGKGKKQLVRLTVDTDGGDGTATDTLTATAGHPFWVPSLKKWLKAAELKPGMWLRTGSGTWVKVEAVKAWIQNARVHNLTVDNAHTYYVLAGAAPVLVHNCGETTNLYRVSPRDRGSSELDDGLNADNFPSVADDGEELTGAAHFGNEARVNDFAAGHSGTHGQGFEVEVPNSWLRDRDIEVWEGRTPEQLEYLIPRGLMGEFNQFPRRVWTPGGAS